MIKNLLNNILSQFSKVSQFLVLLSVIVWISFTIYVIVPKLPPGDLLQGLITVIGLLSIAISFIQSSINKRDVKLQECENEFTKIIMNQTKGTKHED